MRGGEGLPRRQCEEHEDVQGYVFSEVNAYRRYVGRRRERLRYKFRWIIFTFLKPSPSIVRVAASREAILVPSRQFMLALSREFMLTHFRELMHAGPKQQLVEGGSCKQGVTGVIYQQVASVSGSG